MCLATKWCHRCSSQNCIYYFGTSILVMVCLVACSHACVVSSYQKCETVVESSVVRNTLMPEGGGDCHALFTATGRQQCDKLPAARGGLEQNFRPGNLTLIQAISYTHNKFLNRTTIFFVWPSSSLHKKSFNS